MSTNMYADYEGEYGVDGICPVYVTTYPQDVASASWAVNVAMSLPLLLLLFITSIIKLQGRKKFHHHAENESDDQENKAAEFSVRGRLSMDEYIKLERYAYDYIVNNKCNIKLEKNESGFFTINIKKPDFIDSTVGIKKLRINYWPIDNSNEISPESIHSHPRYFESYIIYGGYVHSIYEVIQMNDKSNDDNLETFNRYRIYKDFDGKKSFKDMGPSFIGKVKDERVKEGKLVIMPTNVIHRVLYSVAGSLSLNIVYEDQSNKDYFDLFVSQKGNENNVAVTRPKLSGEKRDEFINQIEKKLFNSLFQKEY